MVRAGRWGGVLRLLYPGHTLNLRHQADWVDGVKVSDYREGVIMGVGYYRPNVYWAVGLNSYGQIQDDRAIIKQTLN
jgi:hypothetical protein